MKSLKSQVGVVDEVNAPESTTMDDFKRVILEIHKKESLLDCVWMTTEMAAAYLKISPGSLRNMTSNGQVPYHKFGRRNRYLKSELDQLLHSKKRGGSYGN